MFNPKIFLFLFCLVFLLVFPSLFAQETITITTYYPSPYGSYGSLHTDKLGVGDNDGSGGPTAADIPTTTGNVWIAGNVGIGTTTPTSRLDIVQASGSSLDAGIRLEYGLHYARIFLDTSNGGLVLTADGSAGVYLPYGAQAWQGYSDIRLKKKIEVINNALDKIMSIRGVYFNWKDENASQARQVGVIGQEAEKYFPEIVSTTGKGYKTIAYSNFAPYLIEAIKELKSQNDALKARIEALEKKL